MGQLGGRRRDPRRRRPAASSTGTSCTTSTSRAAGSPCGPVDHAAPAAGPAASWPPWRTPASRTSWPPRRADVVFVTPAATPARRRRSSPRCACRRGGRRPHRAAAARLGRPRRRARHDAERAERRGRPPRRAGRGARATDAAIVTRRRAGELADLFGAWHALGRRRRPPAAGASCRTTSTRIVDDLVPELRGRGLFRGRLRRPAPCAGMLGPADRVPRQPATPRRSTPMTKPAKQIHPRRPLPRREQHHGLERPDVRQPDRLRLVRAPRPDGRAGQVRLLLPRRGAATARAPRADLRPRRRRPARHAHGARRAGRGHRRTSVWPARSTPRSTSPTSWPASSPRSTTSPAVGPHGTW